MQRLVLRQQRVLAFAMRRVGHDAVGGADVHALLGVVRADALGALGGVDRVDR